MQEESRIKMNEFIILFIIATDYTKTFCLNGIKLQQVIFQVILYKIFLIKHCTTSLRFLSVCFLVKKVISSKSIKV